MHADNRDQHGDQQRDRGWAYQQADDQGQATEELGAAGQCGHQITRRDANALHPLRHAGQAIAAKPTKQLLRAVGGKRQAGDNPQQADAVAGVGAGNGFEQSIHGVILGLGR